MALQKNYDARERISSNLSGGTFATEKLADSNSSCYFNAIAFPITSGLCSAGMLAIIEENLETLLKSASPSQNVTLFQVK
jgi:hypothetical protein